MNKNEMLPVNSYTALKDFNLAEAMNDELSGMEDVYKRQGVKSALCVLENTSIDLVCSDYFMGCLLYTSRCV